MWARLARKQKVLIATNGAHEQDGLEPQKPILDSRNLKVKIDKVKQNRSQLTIRLSDAFSII